ncbi:MAG: pitrilysin family protein [Nanoarchaeota archaeon]|nr:pitrilysin family protein [Nanoarchaeota archaeon]
MEIEKSRDELLGREIYSTRLSSGMVAYFFPLDSSVDVSLCNLFTRFGSIDAEFRNPKGEIIQVEDGTAHFLEHSAFYDPDGKNALEWFQKRGLSPNAWTFFDHTAYHFQAPGRNIRNALDYLLTYVTTPYFTDEVVKKEQGVIEQEIRMYQDKPMYVLQENLFRALFKKHAASRSIGGDAETIKSITKEYLQAAYETFYHPSNLNLVIFMPSSNSAEDAARHFAMADKMCMEKGFAQKVPPEYLDVCEPVEVAQKSIVISHEVPEPLVAIGFKGRMGMHGTMEERLKSVIINSLLADTIFSDSSEAVYGLVEKGIIRGGAFGGFHHAGRGFGVFGVMGSIDNAEKFQEGVLRMIREQVNGKLSRDLFETVKNSKVGGAAKSLELEDLKNVGAETIFMLAAGFNPIEAMRIRKGITYEDVLETGKRYLDTDNYAVSIVLQRESK